MRLLIDALRALGEKLPSGPLVYSPEGYRDWQKMAEHQKEILLDPDLPILRIDNVAEYMRSDKVWNLQRHFPNLAPPFGAFWCEWSKQEESGVKHRLGVLAGAWEPSLEFKLQCARKFKGDALKYQQTKWVLYVSAYIDRLDGSPIKGPHGAHVLDIDAQGKLLATGPSVWFGDQGDQELKRRFDEVFYSCWPALLAICFMHCKNVVLEDCRVPAPLVKKYKTRHGGAAPANYQVLVIEPLKSILKREGGADTVGLQRAMHICRGHFADYREGRGLFGKYHQEVFISDFVRGRGPRKAPAPEYEVRKPKEGF